MSQEEAEGRELKKQTQHKDAKVIGFQAPVYRRGHGILLVASSSTVNGDRGHIAWDLQSVLHQF